MPNLLAHLPESSGAGSLDVSRETVDRLMGYLADLLKWSAKINLIAPTTREMAWDRHICDSAQIYTLAPMSFRHWVDLGSGGGLPGLVIAIIASERNPESKITLVESDARKAAFLSLSARTYAPACKVELARAETLAPQGADVVSGRALMRLTKLLGLGQRHMSHDGVCLFPKGAQAADEIQEARKTWRFDLTSAQSRTASDAVVLKISNIEVNNDT